MPEVWAKTDGYHGSGAASLHQVKMASRGCRFRWFMVTLTSSPKRGGPKAMVANCPTGLLRSSLYGDYSGLPGSSFSPSLLSLLSKSPASLSTPGERLLTTPSQNGTLNDGFEPGVGLGTTEFIPFYRVSSLVGEFSA